MTNSSAQVLFLACDDLRNPLATASSTQNKAVNFHVNNLSPVVIARHILILKIVSDENFFPENEEDLGYLWNLLYDATWPQSTLHRFIEDIKSLLNDPLPGNIAIPEMSIAAVKEIWGDWLSMIKTISVADVLASRYENHSIRRKKELNLIVHPVFDINILF